MKVSTELYSREAILETAYRFTDRCHVSLFPADEKAVNIQFTPKENGVNLNTIAKDFLNELIDQQLRHRIRCETQGIQEVIIREAFAPLENVPKADQKND